MATVTTKEVISDFSGREGAIPVVVRIGSDLYNADIHPDDIYESGLTVQQLLFISTKSESERIKRKRSNAIRLWGLANGYKNLPKRGRLPKDLVDDYYGAYPEEKP